MWRVFDIDHYRENCGPLLAANGTPAVSRRVADPSDHLVDVGGGWAMPTGFRRATRHPITLDAGDTVDMVVETDVQLLNTGRLEVVRLCLSTADSVADNVGISSSLLRQIPVGTIVAELAFEYLSFVAVLDGQTIASRWRPGPDHLEDGPTDANLALVAGVYQSASVAGLAPIKAVVDVLGLKRPTAADWVKRAKYAGLIGVHAFTASSAGTAHNAMVKTEDDVTT